MLQGLMGEKCYMFGWNEMEQRIPDEARTSSYMLMKDMFIILVVCECNLYVKPSGVHGLMVAGLNLKYLIILTSLITC